MSNQRNSNSPEEMPGARMTRQFFEETSLLSQPTLDEVSHLLEKHSVCSTLLGDDMLRPRKIVLFLVINLRKNLSSNFRKKLVPYVGFDKEISKESLCFSMAPLINSGTIRHSCTTLNGRKLRVPKAGKGNTRRLKSTIHFR